jgi:hypothetical protein
MAPDTDLASAIAVERAKFINRNLPLAVIGGFLIACVVAATFWDVASQRSIVTWLIASFALTVYRLTVWRIYAMGVRNLHTAKRYISFVLAGAALSGCLWGMTALFLMPADLVLYHVILVFSIALLGVTAMFSYGVHYPIFLAFFLPSILAMIIGLLMQGTALHVELATGMIIFVMVALRLVAGLHHMFLRTLELHYENTELVRQLGAAKQ